MKTITQIFKESVDGSECNCNTQSQNTDNGVYVGVRLSERTESYIKHMAEKLGITEMEHSLHSTLIYAEGSNANGVSAQDVECEEFETPILGKPVCLKLLGENQDCLVLEYECEELHERQKKKKDKYGFTHSYANFIPHITMAYGWGGGYGGAVETPEMPDMSDFGGMDGGFGESMENYPIEIICEYAEPIDPNWEK